jgi:hypothetical protein
MWRRRGGRRKINMLYTTIVIVVLSLLCVLFIISTIFLFKSLKISLDKIDVYEKQLEDSNKKLEEYEKWTNEVKSDVLQTFEDMKDIDNRQLFVKDDEVGVVFQELLDVIKKLNERVL